MIEDISFGKVTRFEHIHMFQKVHAKLHKTVRLGLWSSATHMGSICKFFEKGKEGRDMPSELGDLKRSSASQNVPENPRQLHGTRGN
jgi:hypothetical protein